MDGFLSVLRIEEHESALGNHRGRLAVTGIDFPEDLGLSRDFGKGMSGVGQHAAPVGAAPLGPFRAAASERKKNCEGGGCCDPGKGEEVHGVLQGE
jgi:hypothetical protein